MTLDRYNYSFRLLSIDKVNYNVHNSKLLSPILMLISYTGLTVGGERFALITYCLQGCKSKDERELQL